MSKKKKEQGEATTEQATVKESKEQAVAAGLDRLCVAQTHTRNIYVYPTLAECTLSPEARKKANVYDGFEDFCERVSDTEIDEFAKNFSVDMRDVTNGRLRKGIVWEWMIAKARSERKDMTLPRSERTGVKKEGKLTNRKYIVESATVPKDVKFPPQAIACLEIMVGMKRPEILEQDLKDEIDKRQDMLHTRQEPWRIFQYYRPQLMQHKLIRMV